LANSIGVGYYPATTKREGKTAGVFGSSGGGAADSLLRRERNRSEPPQAREQRETSFDEFKKALGPASGEGRRPFRRLLRGGSCLRI
jgi:hypothetical protein